MSSPGLQSFIAKNSKRDTTVWPPARWDLDLLTLAAFYYQPSLEVARADWRSAQGATITAAARLNPSVSAAGGYDNGIANNFSVWQPSITFDIPLQTAGKRHRKMEQARWESESAHLAVAQAAWQARSQLRSSLVDFVTAQRRTALLRQQSDLQKQIASRLAQELQAGAVANTEVTAAAIALSKTAADLTDAERQMIESRARVADAIGIPASALDG
ncbi:MAG TPA: TolC family protein, partial [Candidatus Binataceae bacterium]|nr:TolC family protein [Candidatus Binataceae bacterium]